MKKYPLASLESAYINTERLLYSGLDSGRVNKSTVPGYPVDGTTSPNDYLQQLSGSGYKIGSGIILKVPPRRTRMTGDQVAIKVSSWYKKNGATPNSPNDLAAGLVASLINSLTGAGGPVHGSITSSQLSSSGVIPLSTTDFLNNRSAPDTTKPKAYLNWVLLDEQFKFVSNGSGAEQVGNDQEFKLHTPTSNISKSGYLYVFVSNETPNINTFFDNLQVTHIKGPLLEESHYYPFGTEMSAISSHSLPSYVPNSYKANGGAEYGEEEWSNGGGLEMYETYYRSYNAQIGRFMQGDPMMEATITMGGYVFSGNNPAMFTDLLGDQYKYMDKMGNRWHHADVLEGTALEGQQYVEGYGLDGFGDSWIGDVQNGAGGGGKGHGSSQTDYTSQWEEIVAGFNSGKGDSWSPGYGFYDGSLYPAGVNWVKLAEVVVKENINQQVHWDLNKDGILQKYEADYWYLNGNGKAITVNGNKVNLEGLSADDMTYNPRNGTYALSTTNAFKVLPHETAATYGGSIFKRVNGRWQMLSQRYHYDMREWNSKENIIRNLLTIVGDPSNTLRPSEMNKVHPNFTAPGKYFTIIIKY